MTGFTVTQNYGQIDVETDHFKLIFNMAAVGITKFSYEKGGNEHNCVGTFVPGPVLFAPSFTASELPGGILWPDGGITLELEKNFGWFVQIKQSGYLRNILIPTSTDFHYTVYWYLWPSGRIACRMEIKNMSGDTVLLDEEAYRLNPPNDTDINPARDTSPNLEWFGFYSNNTGNGETDLSHDAVVVHYVGSLNLYDASGKVNRIYDEDVPWLNNETITRWFLLALSVEGSWGDCADSADMESRGDAISADLKNPDPLNGHLNAGDVITGTLIGSGFDEYTSAYTVGV